ncbi:MAG: Asp-tRNA(Asn)/Glu-tRNA(Gln) amidotransferase subunit GatC [Planctomycetaceae bacterium]
MDQAEVQKVARLARLAVAEGELSGYQQRLGAVLEYVRLLDEAADLRGVEPLYHPLPLQNVFREDVSGGSLSREEALANACRTDGQYFLVPRILEEK